ncbi:molybdenum cofactor guanylyltransferase MobA [Histidinibacterium aquaticum]|uniref:Molybdenum cofactor guanylyltransferase n=1 Tax=Histidinibacterium aquaticum TaxID=2613962 RepID=A0A5J5GSX5_9RHOB|nr:molybdenum cofactor guanylyltransferase MobA [Histidinibacterium aquaticum]KAA9010743.1 molybdenum cofactor guanylyltransferase MobA [Histidinibacterium aquaticum]
MQISGVILAGGTARRMGGGDKGRLEISGVSLLVRVIQRLEPQVAGLALSANGAPERFADLGLPVMPDETPDRGPLAGVLAGLDWARGQGADALVTAPADTPFLPADLVPRLRRAGPVAIAHSGGRDHPTCGLWAVALAPLLRERLDAGDRRLMAFADAAGAARAEFDDDRAFFNVNTPEDLARAEALAEEGAA